MAIGFSDGTSYEDMHDYYLGQPHSKLQAPDTREEPDYDMEAAKADGVKPDARGHWPDTYKKPNHITFSDESKFNDGGAGHWEQGDDKKWSFTPGPTNLKHHSIDEIRKYFKREEPDSTLIEPKQDQTPFKTAQDEEADPFGNKTKGKNQDRVPQGPYDPSMPRNDTQKPTGEFKSPGGTQVAESWSTNPKGWDEGNWNDSWELMEPYGGAGGNPQSRDQLIKKHPDMEFLDDPYDRYDSPSPGGSMYFRKPPNKAPETSQIDRDHNVPLIASALTKDGSTMHGMAVDHRVNLAMNFEGKDHDITPFLWAHEQAELGPMAAAVKGGMDAKDAYELAHDKVANPAEAAVRNSYAIKAGLDVDKFNEAYWSHINTQKDIAAQPSDKPRHPDAHTTRYGLDPT